MTQVRFDDISARYTRTGPPVLAGLDLTVEPGTLTTLLGPSGCGKTTVLRLLAGLLHPAGGDLRLSGRSVVGVPAERRGVAMVFQQPLLFDHLDVAGNVGFGLRMRGVDRAGIRRRVGELLDLVHLTGLEHRRPGELSGGQAQRVALARALIVQPRVLLLDEPLSQLDTGLRHELRELIRRLQRDLALTTLLVTHDQEEAAAVSDRIALLLNGRVAQYGPPQDLYDRPASLPVAGFLGTANLIPGTVTDGVWSGPLGPLPTGVPDGPATLAVRQEALVVDLDPDTDGLPATISDARYRGTAWDLDLTVRGPGGADGHTDGSHAGGDLPGGTVLHAVAPPTLKTAPGDLVRVRLPAGHGHVIPG